MAKERQQTAKEKTQGTINNLDRRGVLNKVPVERLAQYIEGQFNQEAKADGYFHGVAYCDVIDDTNDLLREHYPPPPNMDDIPG